MFDDSIKFNTMYVNRHSGMATYFFFKKNNVLFGARKNKDSKWKFATWYSYSNIKRTDDIKEQNDLEEMERETIVTFWNYNLEYM